MDFENENVCNDNTKQQLNQAFIGYAQIVDTAAPDDAQPLLIDQKGIAFFAEIVAAGAVFQYENGDRKSAIIWATFFSNIPNFKRTVRVDLFSNIERGPEIAPSKKSVPVIFCKYDPGKVDDEDASIKLISAHTRKSATLPSKRYATVGVDLKIATDHCGFGLLGAKGTKHGQFIRAILCQALAQAYGDILKEAATKLASYALEAQGEAGNAKLIDAYEKFLRFLAAAYTSRPVKLEKHEIFEIWRAIASHHQLEDQRREVEDQLRSLGGFLQAENSQEQLRIQVELHEAAQQREKSEREEQGKNELFRNRTESRQKWIGGFITFIALLISFFSLPDRFLTPILDVVSSSEESVSTGSPDTD